MVVKGKEILMQLLCPLLGHKLALSMGGRERPKEGKATPDGQVAGLIRKEVTRGLSLWLRDEQSPHPLSSILNVYIETFRCNWTSHIHSPGGLNHTLFEGGVLENSCSPRTRKQKGYPKDGDGMGQLTVHQKSHPPNDLLHHLTGQTLSSN